MAEVCKTTCFVDSGLEPDNFLNSDISQGSSATRVRSGGKVNDGFVAYLLLNLSVKKI